MEAVGYAGAAAVLLAYALVARRGPSLGVHLLNLAGAVGIIVNSLFHEAYPSVALNLAWVAVAVYGLTVVRREPSAPIPPRQAEADPRPS